MHFNVFRGDFKVQFKHEIVLEGQFKHDNASVFNLFYNMTLSMLRRSVTLHERTGKMIYHRILWSKCGFVCMFSRMYAKAFIIICSHLMNAVLIWNQYYRIIKCCS